jgi:hypothetical protein
MAGETPEAEALTRATTATTERKKVRHDQIKFDLDRYLNRDPEALKSENLTPLMESLVLEGLQVPIEFYRDEQGNAVLLKGHRRVSA